MFRKIFSVSRRNRLSCIPKTCKVSLFSNTTGLPVVKYIAASWTYDANVEFVSPSTPIRGRRLSDVEEGHNTCVEHLRRQMKMELKESKCFRADLGSLFYQFYELYNKGGSGYTIM